MNDLKESFSSITTEGWVAIYGALLATGHVIVSAIKYYIESQGKIQVKFIIKYGYFLGLGNIPENGQYFVYFTMTNRKEKPRYIERPIVELNRPTSAGKVFTPFNKWEPANYPKLLEHGEQYEVRFVLNEFLHAMSGPNYSKVSKLRVAVKDTLNKWHYSDWMKLEVLTKHLERINKEHFENEPEGSTSK